MTFLQISENRIAEKSASLILFLCLVIMPFSIHAAITPIIQDTLASWITNGTAFDFILIDVRTPSEVAGGIIATDSCRPYNYNVSDGSLDSVIPDIPKTMAVVVYCASGNRAITAANKLDAAGIQHVYRMITGFSTWTGPTKSSTFLKSPSLFPQPSRLAKPTSTMQAISQSSYNHQYSPSLMIFSADIRQSHLINSENIFDLRGRISAAFRQHNSPFLLIPMPSR
jgi:phage shock protein E